MIPESSSNYNNSKSVPTKRAIRVVQKLTKAVCDELYQQHYLHTKRAAIYSAYTPNITAPSERRKISSVRPNITIITISNTITGKSKNRAPV